MAQAPRPMRTDHGPRDDQSSGNECPTLVFVHGAGHDHATWQSQTAHFADAGHAVLAPDLPGHGSNLEPPRTAIEAMAEWLLAALDERPSGPLHLVGHSMGSLVALEAAARGGARVASLVLIGSTLPMRVAPALLDAARDDPAQARRMINEWSFAPPDIAGGQIPEAVLAANLAMMARQPTAVLATDLAACDRYAGGPAAAAAVRCPSWLICGEGDRMTPPAGNGLLQQALAAAGRPVQARTIAGCGHAIMAEQPDRLNQTLERCWKD